MFGVVCISVRSRGNKANKKRYGAGQDGKDELE